MSYKIADFSSVHKVSHVHGSTRKYASAVKIGNTNQFGWHEPTTPTEKDKIHTYLDLNGYHPTARNVCLKSARLWTQFAWNGTYRTNNNFLKSGISLQTGHPPFTNRNSIRSFGNKYNNNWGPNHPRWGYSGYNQCELERKNIPYVGNKYNVSFWLKVNNSSRYDAFYYYQNNYNVFPNGDTNDMLLRLLNNLSSNQLEALVLPKSGNEMTLMVIQKFVDWKSHGYKTWWYNGLQTTIPVNKWIFVSVSVDGNDLMITYNKEIATSKQFKYEDLRFGKMKVDKIGLRRTEYKGLSPGRNNNFNETSDSNRLHGIGVQSNNVQVADFRVYGNTSFIDDWKNLSHLQNHREQLGDLPKVLHTGSFSQDTETEMDDIYPDFGEENNLVSSIDFDLNFAMDLNNPMDKREDKIKKISDENSITEDFLKEQILDFNHSDLDYLNVDEI